MSVIKDLSDADLREELNTLGFNAGPVTTTTRKLYEKKLEILRKNAGQNGKTFATPAPRKASPAKHSISSNVVTTPVSAKRKGRKPEVVDGSSDEELDLTVSSPVTTRITRTITPSNKKVTSEVVDHSPPRTNTLKRTPTPPRSARTTRTPLRNEGGNLSVRGNLFSESDADIAPVSPANTRRGENSMFSTKPAAVSPGNVYRQHQPTVEENDEDDHMETSRTVPRYTPFNASIGSNRSSFGFGSSAMNDLRSSNISYGVNSPYQKENDSPIDKFRRFSQGAWGYFSRSNDTATPCADPRTYRETKFGTRHSRYAKYSPNSSRLSSSSVAASSNNDPCDVSGWILSLCITFLAIIIALYICTANPETIQRATTVVTGVALTTFNYVYAFLLFPIGVILLVGLAAGGAYQLNKFRETKKKERQAKLMTLVDRITDVIRDHGSEGIPELHVRDILMPPTKRSNEDWALWNDAAKFINLEDSRVRTEVRLVNGDECNVWLWVPTTKQKWQGTAISEKSLSHNIPVKALTRCIKLRGITLGSNGVELEALRADLLHKLSPVVPVHMDFAMAPENIVYIMLKNLDDAKEAFMTFHSQWFQGGMITAKYLRDERYMERFPDAVRSYK